ncbi:YqaA family protein [Oleisolibacter albus]|uniref:YqaA family protein n=1 Tax=Oleisolibacter albus TaxID=2171757 RepID=UPI000DF3C996|nr:YqaA family protein [Oleisolibacter albus]
MIRPLYDWTMRMAAHPRAVWVLAAISFAESSFFPIPPDVMLIPLIMACRQRAFMLALVCTLSSVIGGFAGYAIGYFLFDGIGRAVFEAYGLMPTYDSMRSYFDQYGAWVIMIKGMTPIPFKLLTIASGALHFDLLEFAGAAIISRSVRFFLVAALLWKFGAPIRAFVEERLTLVTTVFVLLLVGGFVAVKFIH